MAGFLSGWGQLRPYIIHSDSIKFSNNSGTGTNFAIEGNIYLKKFGASTDSVLAVGPGGRIIRIPFSAIILDSIPNGGTHLYFTTELARGAFYSDGPILYDSALGRFYLDTSSATGAATKHDLEHIDTAVIGVTGYLSGDTSIISIDKNGGGNSKIYLLDPGSTGSVYAASYASLAAAVTALAATSRNMIVSTPMTLTANLTVPANISLTILKGGSINTNGYTLAINGAFEAGRYQVFSGTGAITFGNSSIDYQFPEWDGAKSDGTDSAAGTRAFALQVARFVPIKLGIGTYLVDSIRTITAHSLIIVGDPQMFHSTIQASATSAEFIKIGDSVGVEHSYLANLAINGTSLNGGGITLGGDVGGFLLSGQIRGYTAYTHIDNVYISNFTRTGAFGVQLKRVQECDINVRFNNNYNAVYRPNLGYCTTTHFKGDICYLGRSLNRGASIEGRCQDIAFNGITVESNINEGIYFNYQSGYSTIRIEGCYFEQNSTGGTGTISITGGAGSNAVSAIIKNNQFHLNHTDNTRMLFLDSVRHSVVSQNFGLMQFQDSGIVIGDAAQVHFEQNNAFDNFTTAYFTRYKWLRGNVSVADDLPNLSRYNIFRTLYGGTSFSDTLVLKPHTNYLNPDRGMYLYGPKIFFGANSIDDSLNVFDMPTGSATIGGSVNIGGSTASSKLSVGSGDIIIDNNRAYRSLLADSVTSKVILRETASNETELHSGGGGIRFMNNAAAQLAKLTNTGYFGIGITTDATARLELKASSSPAGFGSFKINPGNKLTTPEAGIIENDSTNGWYYTDAQLVRRQFNILPLNNIYTGSGALSSPGATYNGTWITGGSSTTTKPYILFEPSGTTSSGWNTSGTGLGINAASGFTGNLIDLKLAGTSKFIADYTGLVITGSDTLATKSYARTSGGTGSYEVPLTISTGLTRSTNTITNNLSTGIASSNQTAIGSTLSGGTFTLSSTSHATKGKVIFGTLSAYDEVNDRIGIGTTSPSAPIHTLVGGAALAGIFQSGSGGGSIKIGADVNNGTLTSSTRKIMRVVMPAYDAGATNVLMFAGDVTGTNLNDLYIGGEPGASPYASTGLHFVTAATGTTTGGTERMTIDLNGKVGIGNATPATTAILDVTSTSKGFLPPRMTKTQRDAISSPATGLTIWQTDNTPGLRSYNGTNWMRYTETAD